MKVFKVELVEYVRRNAVLYILAESEADLKNNICDMDDFACQNNKWFIN